LFENYAKIKLRIYFQKWNIKSVKRNMVLIFNAIQKILHLNKYSERALMKSALD